MIRALAFTGGVDVPSARFRVRQFIAGLSNRGILLKEFHGNAGKYPPKSKWERSIWGASRVTELIPACIESRFMDVVLLQREMISTLPSLEGFTGRPRVLDVDDSIHLVRGGHIAKRLAVLCDRILCGNDYLADVYSRWNRNVAVLPTAVDTSRYIPRPRSGDGVLVVGWIGTTANHKYLLEIEEALAKALAGLNAVIRVVSDTFPQFKHLNRNRVEFEVWTQESEIFSIQGFDVGLMPLRDDEWARGKCSFKMLQYMACAIPVVVSPVGMNRQVLEKACVGFAASDAAEWITALRTLLSDFSARNEMGLSGRRVVEDYYSVEVLEPQLAQHLREVAGISP